MAANSIPDSLHFLQELQKNILTINTHLQQIEPLVERSKGLCCYLEDYWVELSEMLES